MKEVSGVSEGSSVFYCPASGSPAPEITWFKDGIPLGEDNYMRFYDDAQVIEIVNVDLRHEGAYSCMAVNSAGQITRTFVLDVSGK